MCHGGAVLATLSGRTADLPRTQFDSSLNEMCVELRTDGTVASSGFRATVTAIEIQLPPTGVCMSTMAYLV